MFGIPRRIGYTVPEGYVEECRRSKNLTEQDEYIKRRLTAKLKRPFINNEPEVEYGGAKLPSTVAVIIEKHKRMFEKWRKNPLTFSENGVKETLNDVIDRFANKLMTQG